MNEDVKETTALDFRFGNKKREEQKARIQSYELGGGRVLASMLGATLRNIDSIGSICIVLDLSKPGNVIDSLIFWLKAVRAYSDNALKELQNVNIERFREVQKRMSVYWQSVAAQSEKQQLNISMVPITVIGAKYDLFAQQNEPVQKKLVCSALRYICHKNGCDLVFASIKEQNPLKQFKNMMNWHIFKPMPKEGEQMQIPQPDRDPLHAISICAGQDSASKIGEP